MKIIVPTNGDNIKSPVSKSFGRSQNFLVVDSSSMSFEKIENIQNMESAQGAGIQSAQSALKAGGDILITLNCGPKAYKVLNSAGIRVYSGVDGSVEENIQKFNKNELKTMDDANKEGHWI